MTLRTLIELQERVATADTSGDYYAARTSLADAARNFDFAALQKRMEEMEQELRFYADDDNYVDSCCEISIVQKDNGKKARKVLGS